MNPADAVAGGSLLIAVPIAVLAGLISFLSPCVLPLVPGYLGFIGGAVGGGSARAARANPGRTRLLLGVLLFIAGFTLVFMSVAMLGGTLGRFLIEYADPITRVLGVVIIIMGLVFIGVFGLAQRTMRPQVRGNLGLVGAPLLGVALGIGWTPCIGPTLAVILGMSFDQGSAGRGALLGLAYSLGLGIPFVLLTLGFGWATRSVGFLRRHIRAVNIVGGVVLILLGLLMVTGVWTAIMSQLQGVFASVPLPL
ncbi:cytochrome c biogenesis protein CcdA [Microbacterium sp. ARD31]|uniref:cytochrome c biogenesis CcdA family protein n=1 Tax=Microbacterium sp. ARD31 TaxID=2962576 RepID=UPI002880F520|nr:cytochrome c biogenesis protein CcdA [Microbacterium sp. ARD31]MDT0180525.1 cytochrome c biogenesis protein CcdA [Microbacterium sp. ARD31]